MTIKNVNNQTYCMHLDEFLDAFGLTFVVTLGTDGDGVPYYYACIEDKLGSTAYRQTPNGLKTLTATGNSRSGVIKNLVDRLSGSHLKVLGRVFWDIYVPKLSYTAA